MGWTLQSVSAGSSWRSLGSLDYTGTSRSRGFLIPSVVGPGSNNQPPIGTVGGIGDRVYDDGFVNVDGTGSADGSTWFWGYDSAGQVSGDNLLFSATGNRSVFSERRSLSGGIGRDETLEAFSPQIDLLLNAPASLNFPVDGMLVSFSFFSESSNGLFSNFAANQTRNDFRIDFIDTFDISSISPLVGAPYEGSLGGPGPVISNLPANRSESEFPLGTETAEFSNAISTSVDLDGFSLAVGPTWQGRISSNWAWQASAGLTFNVFKW